MVSFELEAFTAQCTEVNANSLTPVVLLHRCSRKPHGQPSMLRSNIKQPVTGIIFSARSTASLRTNRETIYHSSLLTLTLSHNTVNSNVWNPVKLLHPCLHEPCGHLLLVRPSIKQQVTGGNVSARVITPIRIHLQSIKKRGIPDIT